MRFDADQTTRRPLTGLRSERAATRFGMLAAVRPDLDLTTLNGSRLTTSEPDRPDAANRICSVSYRAELRPTAWQLLTHLADPQASLIARSRITGGVPVEEYEAAGLVDSTWSMDSAAAAAASYLGSTVAERGTGALVEALRSDAVGIRIDDVITAVDAESVRTAVELRSLLAGRNSARLRIERDGTATHTDIRRAADGAWGIRVVTAGRALRHGYPAAFNLPDDLRGPSLGLACALSIIDAYTGGRLAAGGMVVATGTVDLAGRVGGVGAVKYKARAVRAHSDVRRFLVPAEWPEDVEDARRILDGHAEVVAVATLAEAVEVLRSTT